MKDIIKIVAVILVTIILIASAYVIFFTDDNSSNNNNNGNGNSNHEDPDTEPPEITDITGDLSIYAGTSVTISVSFSDNENVTEATFYYKKANDTTWKSKSILSGSTSLSIPSTPIENWHYYVTVDDAAGNGPIGDPSTDGTTYYTITVVKKNGGNSEEYTHFIFVEEATATWCSNCPAVGELLHELYESNDHNMYYVSLVSDENNIAENRLSNEYNIYGYPTVFIDGGYQVLVGGGTTKQDIISAFIEAEQRSMPKLVINLTSHYDNVTNIVTVSVSIRNLENTSYSGTLKVYLGEIISTKWNDYDGKRYKNAFIDFVLNQEISISKQNTKEITEEYNISDYNPENLVLIAVVFNNELMNGFANPPDENPFDAYYADAAARAFLTEERDLPPEAGIVSPTPNTIYIRGTSRFKAIAGFLGQTILLGKFSTITAYANDDNQIEKVEIYLDDTLLGNYTEEPYEWSYTGILFKKPIFIPRKYTIKVIAYDNSGQTATASREILAWRAFKF